MFLVSTKEDVGLSYFLLLIHTCQDFSQINIIYNKHNQRIYIYIYIYKDGNGNICNDLNIFLHESLVLAPIITLMALFCSTVLRRIRIR
jgi:hypothetical protein